MFRGSILATRGLWISLLKKVLLLTGNVTMVSDSHSREAAAHARRRRKLMRALGRDCAAVVPAAATVNRSGDVAYPYRQNSNFAYLTGFHEPGAIAVFAPGCKLGEYVLFCLPRDKQRELWDGPRAGCRGAVRDFGADRAFPVEDFERVIPRLLVARKRVYCPMDAPGNGVFERRRPQRLRFPGAVARGRFSELEEVLHEMRLRKSSIEIATMKKAAAISVAAHRRAMRACSPGMFEYQLAAELHHEFERAGASPAYPTIVGGGVNACTLHYTRNADTLRDGDLVLIDAGAEYRLYASDVTRTFPVGGRFKPAQRDLYNLVLEAQRAALSKVRPGNTWNDVHRAAVRVLTRGLVGFGLLDGKVPRLVSSGEYRRFYPHRTGHWLGMDVHDVGGVRAGRRLRRFAPGMALTIEPGLYIRSGADVARCWRNIGIRIEDDVVVTATGARVLSDSPPAWR